MDLEYLGLSFGKNTNEMEGQILILCTRIASSMHRMSSTDGEETVSNSNYSPTIHFLLPLPAVFFLQHNFLIDVLMEEVLVPFLA
jgi:hypothetical protein